MCGNGNLQSIRTIVGVLEKAVDEAVTYCIDHNILREFLMKHKAEVIDVCITEYDEQALLSDADLGEVQENGIELQE